MRIRAPKFLRAFPSPIPIIFIIIGTIAVIFYGRGYRLRPDAKGNSLKPTGLLSAASDPIGSEVYVNGVLKSATNTTLNIDPGFYTVKIAKEGYIPWEKKLRVQGEVVTHIDPFLFPANPSLSPLTTVGIENPILSPDGTKIAYTIPLPSTQNGLAQKKAGLWVYELAERPLGFNRDQRQVGVTDNTFNFSGSQLSWSPDSTQIMVSADKNIRLYQIARLNDFGDISNSYQTVLRDWDDEKQQLNRQKLIAFKQGIVDVATESAHIIAFSPDESKILYEATASATIPQIITPPLIGTDSTPEERTITSGKLYVYDSREDKNYFVLDTKELPFPLSSPLPSPSLKPATRTQPTPSSEILTNSQLTANIHWFPTSRHLVLTLPGKIDIMEYDRTNWVTVYSGPFVDGFIAPWPNGSRIIIKTNLNPGVSLLPNLYTVNLR